MVLSQHARIRSQQRGIPLSPFVVELLDRFGTERAVASGGTSVYLDRTAKRRVREFLGGRVYAKLEPLIDDAFAVEKDDQVLTVDHRTRRLRER